MNGWSGWCSARKIWPEVDAFAALGRELPPVWKIAVDWTSLPRKLPDIFMKPILTLFCLVLVLFQPGCAIGPPIDQQTLEQQKAAQSEKKSDAFARDLAQ